MPLRRLGIISLLLSGGCSQAHDWSLNRMQCGHIDFNSSRLTHSTDDLTNGMDVEILTTKEGTHLYLNVHSHPIKPYKDNPKRALVQLYIGEEKTSGLAYRHEGGQRLLLSDDLRDKIITALLSDQALMIKVPGYSVTLSPGTFPGQYEMLKRSPLFKNPFRSPL